MNRLLTAGPPRPCVPSARETSVSPGVERFPKRRKNSRRNAALGQQGRWHANITALQYIQVAGAVNEDGRAGRPSGRGPPGARTERLCRRVARIPRRLKRASQSVRVPLDYAAVVRATVSRSERRERRM